MRGRQVSSQHFQGHAHASKQGICVEEEFKPSLSYEDPRIGMEDAATFQGTASPTHRRGVLRICVGNRVKQGRI
ncbi:hypothetical protein PIB30_106634, partial [Stylosanthes scabra]|nr:hypothetical protein [Stylosanthes scabra]